MAFGHEDQDVVNAYINAIKARHAANGVAMRAVNALSSNDANNVQTNRMQGTTQEVVPAFVAGNP